MTKVATGNLLGRVGTSGMTTLLYQGVGKREAISQASTSVIRLLPPRSLTN